MDPDTLAAIVEKHVAALEVASMKDMGRLMAAVKPEVGSAASGAAISAAAKAAITRVVDS